MDCGGVEEEEGEEGGVGGGVNTGGLRGERVEWGLIGKGVMMGGVDMGV